MKLGKFVSMHFALLNYLLSKNEISPPPSPLLPSQLKKHEIKMVQNSFEKLPCSCGRAEQWLCGGSVLC